MKGINCIYYNCTYNVVKRSEKLKTFDKRYFWFIINIIIVKISLLKNEIKLE